MSIRRIIYLLTATAALAWSYPLSAQYGFDFTHLVDPDNRMSQSISNMVKDDNGFLWIASRSGITRYDGHNYRHYALVEAEVIQDNDGRSSFVRMGQDKILWAFSDRGKIYRYSADSDSFDFVDDVSIRDPFRWMTDLYEDMDGNLWLATGRGLLKLNPDKPGEEIIVSSTTLDINCIIPLPGDLLAMGTTNGVRFADTAGNNVDEHVMCAGNNIMSLYYDDASGRLWIGTFSNGIKIWDTIGKKFLPQAYLDELPSSPVKAIRPWKDGMYLVGFDGRGVYAVDTAVGHCEQIFSNADRHGGLLKANGVYDILIDGSNIWVGTYNAGVTVASERRNFEWIRNIPYNNHSLKGSHVYAIHEDRDGDIWFATNLGVSLLQVSSGRWKHFVEEDNSYLTICEDRDGKIWTGGYSTGLYRIDKNTGTIRHIPSFTDSSQLECIYSSYCDPEGDLWFGCLYGPMAQMSVRNGREEIRFHGIEQVRSISPVDERVLFLGTTNGFYLFDRYTGERRLYFDDLQRLGVRSNTFIYSSVIIGKDMWFGTDGGGMNRVNISEGEVENFSTYDGLPSNFIYGIIKDQNGILWASTDKGIFCFDPSAKKFLYNIDLPAKEFLFMSFTEFSDGRMAFGGTEGAVIFDPGKMDKLVSEPRLFLTDLRLSYQPITPANAPAILSHSVNETGSLRLKHNQNSFSFGFVAPDIYRKYNYTYKYILHGFDQEWTTDAGSLSANYTNISPGDYVFHIQCLDGIDGSLLTERRLGITVQKPFWTTTLAKIMYALIFAGLVFGAWSYYRERLFKKQSREREDFFINVAHDIRTPLSLVLAPLDSLEKESGLGEKGREFLRLARQNGNKLQYMVTQLLEFHKESMSEPAKHKFSICDLDDILHDKAIQFEPLAASKGIELISESPGNNIYIETRLRKLDRILDNLLSNAIKYSNSPGQVIIRLVVSPRRTVIEIQDFGIGIAKKEQKKIFREIYRGTNAVNSTETGAGVGLMYTYRLAHQIGAELTFESEENKGTSFYLSFPSYNFHGSDTVAETTLQNEFRSERKRESQPNYYRVLLVEDNDDMRNYLAGILSAEYKTYSVSSAESAMDFFKKNRADIVISDIMMAGMNGDELCRQLKSNIETSHIHVILLTAKTGKDNMMAGLEHGADDYITKPFDVDALRMKVSNALKTRVRLQQYYITRNAVSGSDPDTTEKDMENIKPVDIDEQFIAKSVKIVNDNISNTDFTVGELCSELAMSRTLVYEKLKALTGQSPNEFIRTLRLRHARDLLLTKKYSIPEVAIMSGFPDAKYFSTAFKRYFGVSPSKVE